MSFNDNVQLDPSQVQNRGGMGRGTKIGGGIGGGIVLLLAALFGINPQLLEGLTGTTQDQQSQSQGTAPACKTGADADARLDCRIMGTVNSLNAFWPAYLAQYNKKYPQPKTVLFSGGTNTGCGAATSEVGPFYCPADTDRVLRSRASSRNSWTGSAPPAARWRRSTWWPTNSDTTSRTCSAPSTARSRIRRGPQSGAVRVELQADCYAGLWVRYATTTKDPKTGQPFLEPLKTQDLQDALSAASSVGDDRIQKAATGRVSPESWTHGSSAQRQKWFYQGYTDRRHQPVRHLRRRHPLTPVTPGIDLLRNGRYGCSKRAVTEQSMKRRRRRPATSEERCRGRAVVGS